MFLPQFIAWLNMFLCFITQNVKSSYLLGAQKVINISEDPLCFHNSVMDMFPQLILITACEVDILFSLDTKGNKNVRCQEIHPRSRSFKWGKARFWYCLFDSQANVFHHWDHHFSILQNSLCMICKEIKGRRKWGEGEEKKKNEFDFQ